MPDRRSAQRLIAVAVSALVIGSVLPAMPAVAAARPSVVVAVADTGVNPYHDVYHRPDNTAHPCTWVEGFDDCSVPALELSIGEFDDLAAARAADAEVWASVQPGQWYWIPRTNIIGAVCDRPYTRATDPPGVPMNTCIFDDHGHGTGTTSSVLSESPDALLLVHEGDAGAEDLATAPVIADIQSHSWSAAAPIPAHAAHPVLPGTNDMCRHSFDPQTLFFVAAGNEAPFPTLADCYKSIDGAQVVGGGYPGHWSPASWSTYDFASWFCRPTASHQSTSGMRDSYCGTSFAAPTAAGAAAEALLRVRRADGYTGRSTIDVVSTTLTRQQFIDALRHGASYAPERKFDLEPDPPFEVPAPVPAQAPWLFWGYGWLDSTVVEAVVACATGGSCPEKSAEAQQYNAARQQVRHATTNNALPDTPQNDAGSGRDAGRSRRTAVAITTDRSHDARLEAYGFSGDIYDWYTFTAEAGQRIDVTLTAPLAQWQIIDPQGRESPWQDTTSSSAPPALSAPVDGVYVLSVMAHQSVPPQDYRFEVRLEPAPEVP